MILDKEAFDPDAVFFEDIVDDNVLPKLSLAVDGLVGAGAHETSRYEVSTDAQSQEQVLKPSTSLPDAEFDPEGMEVYGWESSTWRKIRGYLGF